MKFIVIRDMCIFNRNIVKRLTYFQIVFISFGKYITYQNVFMILHERKSFDSRSFTAIGK